MQTHAQGPAPDPPDTPDKDLELLKLKLDYAWKWFSFHADQRTKMFNFMLVVMGIFAAGVAGALKDGIPELAFWLCVVPVVLAFVFIRLDRRNRDLVWLGEDVLREIEKSDLFGRSGESSNVKDEKQLSGILWRQARSEEAWASRRFPIVYIRDAWLGKHRVWLKLIAVLIGVSFLAGAVYVYGNWAKIAERSTTSSIAPAKSGAVTPPAPAK